MLKVSESVNGKFDIVLSEGCRSQLHYKGQGTGEIRSSRKNARTRKQQQLVGSSTHKLPKANEKPSVVPTAKKSSRLAAQFSAGLSRGGKQEPIQSKNKPESERRKHTKVVPNPPSEANGDAAFVTKSDLTNLLEALASENSNITKNVSRSLFTDTDTSTVSLSADLNKNITPVEHNKPPVPLNAEAGISLKENVEQARMQSFLDSAAIKKSFQDNKTTPKAMTEMTKPAAMRSSFAIGAPGVVINDHLDTKAQRHKQWVKDLERQIEEKNEKKQLMKEADQTGTTVRQGLCENNTESGYCLVKTIGETTRQEQTESFTGHGRGRGLMSMIISTDEAEKQKQKIIEHQKAIELQVEDRRKQKQQERERRLREEAMENERLAKEREKLQQQYEEEMRKATEKEEQAKRRAVLLQEGISRAYESAQQLKHERRKNRLQASTLKQANVNSRHSSENDGRHEVNVNSSSSDTSPSHQPVVDSTHRRIPRKQDVGPSAEEVRRSPSEHGASQNISSRLSDPTLQQNLLRMREIKTSYSEPNCVGRSRDLIHKWVEEDVGSCSLIDDKGHVFDESCKQSFSGEYMIPFHRTESATLLTGSVSLLENDGEESAVPLLGGKERGGTERGSKNLKKGRSVPEIKPTRTSVLRKKVANSEHTNSSSSNHKDPHHKGTTLKTVGRQRPRQSIASREATSLHSEESLHPCIVKEKPSLSEISVKNTPLSPAVLHHTPTPHQEKILEQLAALRKGLLIKDQEFKTRIFQVNEYEIPT